jgi:anti-sigma factor RsiW
MADDCSRCREELARLTEENAALRRAALAFGSLAERLNLALQEERRRGQRPTSARETAEAISVSTPAGGRRIANH